MLKGYVTRVIESDNSPKGHKLCITIVKGYAHFVS